MATTQHEDFIKRMKADGFSAATIEEFIHKTTHVNLKIGDQVRLQSLIVDALQRASDVNSTQPFPLCLSSFIQALELFIFPGVFNLESNNSFEVRRNTQKAYLTAVTDFLTSYKSDDHIQSIVQEWEPCRCDTTDSVVQQCHMSSKPAVIWMAIDGMIMDLSRVMVNVMEMRESQLDTREQWPSPSQVLLHGDAAEAVAAANQWLQRTTISSAVFIYLAVLCELVPSTFTRALLLNQDLLDRATFHFEEMVHHAQYPEIDRGYIDLASDLDENISILSGFWFFQAVIRTRHSSVQMICLAPFAFRIYETLLALHSILPNRLGELNNAVISVAFMFYVLIPDEIQPPVMHPALRSPFSYVYARLIHPPLPGICMNPGCQLAASHRCSGCHVTCYCTAECQRAAWKISTAPHSRICKSLQRFVPLLTGEDGVAVTREQYEARATASGIEFDEGIMLLNKLKDLDAALGV
ncbi:hypothetical protein C8J56DRAFT_536551 [Mycena floridula]|nr:hypothetical protein C8J56DRAFT_536551 [Mycena floridula]